MMGQVTADHTNWKMIDKDPRYVISIPPTWSLIITDFDSIFGRSLFAYSDTTTDIPIFVFTLAGENSSHMPFSSEEAQEATLHYMEKLDLVNTKIGERYTHSNRSSMYFTTWGGEGENHEMGFTTTLADADMFYIIAGIFQDSDALVNYAWMYEEIIETFTIPSSSGN